MLKNNFIRAIEIWQPELESSVVGVHGKVETFLKLADCYYEGASDFEALSRDHYVRFNEGLAGQSWAEGRPKILHDLQSHDCVRGEAAVKAGFNCTVAVPVFSGDNLKSVVMLFCSDDKKAVGSVEIWHKPKDTNEIALDDGYFQTDYAFQAETRQMKFMRGFGIAGIVWGTQLPFIMSNLGRNKRFVRSESAFRTGLSRGMGLPCGRKTEDEAWVLTLLSSSETPIADRFECWVPQENGLVFSNGACAQEKGLSDRYNTKFFLNEGTLATVWKTGIPALNTKLIDEPYIIAESAKSAGLSMLVALPVFWGDRVSAVAVWYL